MDGNVTNLIEMDPGPWILSTLKIRRGQKAAAAAAFLASVAGLLHLVLRALSPHDARQLALWGRESV